MGQKITTPLALVVSWLLLAPLAGAAITGPTADEIAGTSTTSITPAAPVIAIPSVSETTDQLISSLSTTDFSFNVSDLFSSPADRIASWQAKISPASSISAKQDYLEQQQRHLLDQMTRVASGELAQRQAVYSWINSQRATLEASYAAHPDLLERLHYLLAEYQANMTYPTAATDEQFHLYATVLGRTIIDEQARSADHICLSQSCRYYTDQAQQIASQASIGLTTDFSQLSASYRYWVSAATSSGRRLDAYSATPSIPDLPLCSTEPDFYTLSYRDYCTDPADVSLTDLFTRLTHLFDRHSERVEQLVNDRPADLTVDSTSLLSQSTTSGVDTSEGGLAKILSRQTHQTDAQIVDEITASHPVDSGIQLEYLAQQSQQEHLIDQAQAQAARQQHIQSVYSATDDHSDSLSSAWEDMLRSSERLALSGTQSALFMRVISLYQCQQ